MHILLQAIIYPKEYISIGKEKMNQLHHQKENHDDVCLLQM